MIFQDKYSGQESEIFNQPKFKEFRLPCDEKHTTRSLELIYSMYCKWLNTRHGIYLCQMRLFTDDDIGVCSDSILDYIFHRVQRDVGNINTSPDKSIGLVSGSYREGTKTIHDGYFLIPMTESEMKEISKGGKPKIPKAVIAIFSRILSQLNNTAFDVIYEEENFDLSFRYLSEKDGAGVILSNSNLKEHEVGFNALSEVARLYKEDLNGDPILFSVRYGYTPAHNYFYTSLFELFFDI